MTCEAWVKGNIYSRKGGNRYEPCTAPAKYNVTGEFGGHFCGHHIRRYRDFNERQWRTDDVLKRPRREPYYLIREIT